jgi:hypothetical protein
LVQVLPHRFGEADGQVQAPEVHVCAEAQTLPHVPQLFRSLLVSVHVPLQAVPLAHPPQTPFEQSSPLGQALPQLPQLSGSSPRLASQPSPGTMLQSPKPGLQAPTPHVPLVHVATAFGGAVQTDPQALQLFGSVSRFASQPSDGL